MKLSSISPLSTHITVCTFLLALSSALGMLFYSIGFGEANIIMVFLLAVLLISVTCGRTIGIIASLVSVVIFNFLFTQPRFTLVVHDTQYIITFLVMFFVAIITSELTNRMKREALESQRRARRMEQLYRTSRNFLRKSGTEAVIDTAMESLHEQLHHPVGCILYADERTHYYGTRGFTNSPVLEKVKEEFEEGGVKEHIRGENRPVGYSTGIRSEAHGYYYPLKNADETLGAVVLFEPKKQIEAEQRGLIEAVCAQLILALDRERLSKKTGRYSSGDRAGTTEKRPAAFNIS